MSAKPYMTSSALIDSVQRRITFPLNQSTFTTDDLLAFANEEISIGLLPSIMSMHEEFYVVQDSVLILPNVSNYSIPYRAIGNKLRDVFYQDFQGNLREMTRVSPDDRSFYGTRSDQNFYYKFYLQGNEIILLPNVGVQPSGNLLLTYYQRPNQLVDESRAAYITSITPNALNPTTQVDIALTALPANITAGSYVDLLQTLPGHKTRAYDKPVLGVNTSTKVVTLPADAVTPDLVVGDYVASAGECIIPQIPSDLHSVLAQRVAARVLEALGDSAGLQAANVKLSEMELKTGNLIDNRTEGAPQKVVNIRGLLRNSRLRRRGRW